ncbi:acyl-CoA thioester hydrolase/BAAT C-terminal domain-containing protein [Pedobacter sp. KR3-3]|uniref:Acyl-CoA thioester hydrolase/BAAT C-terminal domain-containing protein n=1 Tax=Pedobacter albus TaxID=3113905 RepID=A0ABU7I5S9_9SPHI|nr:acyl-CoA thioester hydrolase/BAAT C-terminal domain-containing protein [Pedobacter sp. KR3-3]MEE1944820.1 acyl-CoA thioester hydrolase/BAAT C-terminal domain-containing protein [Pedobacter sp. KR3-3]
MKKAGYIFLFLLLHGFMAVGQIFPKSFFEHYQLSTKKTKSFDIYVTKPVAKGPKPLLIYLDGSGNYPIEYKTKSGRYSTSIAMNIGRYAKDYYVVIISKPGTPFSDSLQYSHSGRAFYPENASYKELYSLDWRAETASAAIDFLVKKGDVDKNKIIVMGYSEGSQVAPKVAVLNKKVTHVVCFVGNALNQLYDFMIGARLQAYSGKISAEEGQEIVDSLYREYAKIYENPTSVTENWYGESYLKWSSFTQTTPLENMLKLHIPILYVAGGRDNNQTILDMDYAKLEFLRKGKKNLTYKVYPNADHYFQEEKVVDGKVKKTDRLDEAHQYAIDWINANHQTERTPTTAK